MSFVDDQEERVRPQLTVNPWWDGEPAAQPADNALSGLIDPAQTPATQDSTFGQKIKNALEQLIGENYDVPGTIQKIQRYQTWPERMVRSGATLPRDMMTGDEPYYDPLTGRVSERAVERAMDLTGLMSGGSLPAAATRGVAKNALGTGPVPKDLPADIAPSRYYSAVERAVANSKMTKATPEQWAGFLKNQPGVKADELSYVGIGDLPQGPVTKDQMLQHVRDHNVKLEESWRGGEKEWSQRDSERLDELEHNRNNLTDVEEAEFQQLVRRENAVSEPGGRPSITKYSDYQLPGGENYRELLMRIPNKKQDLTALPNDWLVNEYKSGGYYITNAKGDVVAGSPTKEGAVQDALEKLRGGHDATADIYRSSHWPDDPNVLLHMRMNDRNIGGAPVTEAPKVVSRDGYYMIEGHEGLGAFMDKAAAQQEAANMVKTQGGLRSLHLEEIQSDWHQAGRKSGYKTTNPNTEGWVIKTDRDGGRVVYDANGTAKTGTFWNETVPDSEIIRRAATDNFAGVPDAPFKTTWADLGLKRALHEAALHGYDALSWTPGEAQAARYDLSKHIDSVSYNPTTGYFKAIDKKGGYALPTSNVAKEKLADTIGKEAAEKLLASKPNNLGIHSLQNADLKVGGEGMKGFYDKMLVDKANALVKKHGGKVEKTSFDRPMDIGNGWEPTGVQQPVHLLRITPQMRASILKEGFPLFSGGLPMVPVDHDPFNDEGVKGKRPRLVPVDHDPFGGQP